MGLAAKTCPQWSLSKAAIAAGSAVTDPSGACMALRESEAPGVSRLRALNRCSLRMCFSQEGILKAVDARREFASARVASRASSTAYSLRLTKAEESPEGGRREARWGWNLTAR